MNGKMLKIQKEYDFYRLAPSCSVVGSSKKGTDHLNASETSV